MQRAVFLDRDGVLNEPIVREGRPYPPGSLEQLKIYPDAPPALGLLRHAGFLLIVVSNQPDVARGTQSREVVQAINDAVAAVLPIDEFCVCFHDDGDACDCRKPRPGLLIQAGRELEIDLTRSYLIGDRWRDIDAGAAAGCRTVLIDRGYRERPPKSPQTQTAASLLAAVKWILADSSGTDLISSDLV